MSKKLTPWFPGHVKPVHHGIYETDADTEDGAPCYQSWNGLWWGWCSSWSDFAVDLDHKHPDTEELTAQVVADVAADAASNNQEAANVAMKE
jgi:thioesterase domain-containing protein